ncbi:MAG TPA: TetR/AcrR family transcriptional regulator [Spirochaetota bacterium]|jgi:AcrR family transcriptional regulator|nr:TetR/AcrR family transcriptional regulator [Spirochaetota bacterium]
MPAKGQKRRQQIVDTAKKMFIEQGFQSTHIGQVCEELNIARGTVYQYFGNKREILYAILESIEESIDDILDPDDLRDLLKDNPSQKDIIKFNTERITECVKAIIEEPIVIKLVFKDIVGIDEEVIERVDQFLKHLINIVSRDVEEIKKKGLYKKTLHADITAIILIGSIMLLVYQFDKEKKDVTDKEVINALVAHYFTGVLK